MKRKLQTLSLVKENHPISMARRAKDGSQSGLGGQRSFPLSAPLQRREERPSEAGTHPKAKDGLEGIL